MTTYKPQSVEIDGIEVNIVKNNGFGAQIENGVLHTEKFDLGIDVSNIDTNQDELTLVIRLAKQTTYT